MLKNAEFVGWSGVPTASDDRTKLQAALESAPLAYGDLAPIHQVLGFYEAVEALLRNDHHKLLMGVLPIVSHRWASEGHFRRIHKDGVISNGAHLLAQEYARLGAWSLATEFYLYSTLTATLGQRKRYDRHCIFVTAYLNSDDDTIATMNEILEHVDTSTSLLLSILEKAKTGNPREIKNAFAEYERYVATRPPGSEQGLGYLLEYILRAANDEHMHDLADDQSAIWLPRLSRSVDHELLGVRQQRAAALMMTSNSAEAQAEADKVVNQASRLEKVGCDDEIWDGLRERYAIARAVRLQAALGRRDFGSIQRYLLEDHVIGRIATAIEPDCDAPAGVEPDHKASEHEPKHSADGHVPAALMRAWEDAANSYAVIEDAGDDVPEVDGILWLLSPHGGSVFWSVAENGDLLAAGKIELSAEPELRDVLDQFHSKYTPGHAERNVEVWQRENLEEELAVAESYEEVVLTGTLGRLLPAVLRERLLRTRKASEPSEAPRLTIGVGHGLPAIPWPIITLSSSTGQVKRLIEVADLQFWLSTRVHQTQVENRVSCAAAAVGRDHATGPYPLLTLIDSLDRDGLSLHEELAESATVAVTWRSGETAEANRQLLETLHSQQRRGVFFYRGHLHHDEAGSSASAYIQIPGRNQEDERLYSGQLFGRYDTGMAWFPMPERVVLSCCSSAASLSRYEALSFAAASIVGAGAVNVIATAIDVDNTPFTDAFDERVAAAACLDEEVHLSLASLQRAMLTEWRLFSARGGVGDSYSPLRAPHPLIWGMYRSY